MSDVSKEIWISSWTDTDRKSSYTIKKEGLAIIIVYFLLLSQAKPNFQAGLQVCMNIANVSDLNEELIIVREFTLFQYVCMMLH